MRNWEFWPMLNAPRGDRPEEGYGPINDDTIQRVAAPSYEAAVAELPAPPPGCFWGLVAMYS